MTNSEIQVLIVSYKTELNEIKTLIRQIEDTLNELKKVVYDGDEKRQKLDRRTSEITTKLIDNSADISALVYDVDYLKGQQSKTERSLKVDLSTKKHMDKHVQFDASALFSTVTEIQKWIMSQSGVKLSHVQIGSYFAIQGIKPKHFRRDGIQKRGYPVNLY